MAKITQELIDREKTVRPFIQKYSEMFGVDANLVRGLITQECRFIGNATSATGAYGFGQFTNIGAKQVQNISSMTPKAGFLAKFTKNEASDPDKGIAAICATLWWLFNKKYAEVTDRKIQLEAALTFYNAGGKPAGLVITHGGHAEALTSIKNLPTNVRSQAVTYAPQVAMWFVEWHDYFIKNVESPPPPTPIVESSESKNRPYKELVQYLLALANSDSEVGSTVNVQRGMTEITLVFPGELV